MCVGGRKYGLNGSQHCHSMFKVHINEANERDEEIKRERRGLVFIKSVRTKKKGGREICTTI